MTVTLLDGGMGQELVRCTRDCATPLWSTQVRVDHPEPVGQVHDGFFAAGATIKTTNTYAVRRDRLERVNLLILETMCSVDQADGALHAADKAGRPGWRSSRCLAARSGLMPTGSR